MAPPSSWPIGPKAGCARRSPSLAAGCDRNRGFCDDDHAAALVEIEQLWGAAVGSDAGDKLDVLTTLVEKYEETRWPVDDSADPVDLLQFAISDLGHSQAELAELLGSRSRASEVLTRKRALTVEMIRSISKAWKIPADLLVRPSRNTT